MGRKKFEEEPYNPLAADMLRDATIQARRRGQGSAEPEPAQKVIDIDSRASAPSVSDEP